MPTPGPTLREMVLGLYAERTDWKEGELTQEMFNRHGVSISHSTARRAMTEFKRTGARKRPPFQLPAPLDSLNPGSPLPLPPFNPPPGVSMGSMNEGMAALRRAVEILGWEIIRMVGEIADLVGDEK